MATLEDQILTAVERDGYRPVKARALARKLNVPTSAQPKFKEALHALMAQGRIEVGKGQLVRRAKLLTGIAGIFRRTSTGNGFVRPIAVGTTPAADIFIGARDSLDAATGDEVLVKLKGKGNQQTGRGPRGVIVRIVVRETRQFVGTYFERDDQAYVRVDGGPFRHSIVVGDAGTHKARPGDKVVLEMLHFPTLDERGEGVIAEVLGPNGAPGVDTLSIIRQFEIPDKFPEDALQAARESAAEFDETDLGEREDLTGQLTITIDPIDAKDFDDAISLERDPRSQHWLLSVHIADVAHFVPTGGALDREARRRGTSVYLPGRVVPMLPELISNGLASLQQGRVRFVKTARLDFTPTGQLAHASFCEAAIRVRRRFHYEEVGAFLEAPAAEKPELDEELAGLLLGMRDLALILQKRRFKRGSLELSMQEAELELDQGGNVTGAHFREHGLSHQIIEEFMLAANEAVAEHLASQGTPFLRRIHPAPEPNKLETFAGFAKEFGYKIPKFVDRFTLQKILKQASTRPEVHAVNYALLRSLKQAVYSPVEDEHFALASKNYCHFTSPIRRYPDLTIHRLLHQWIRKDRVGNDPIELAVLGAQCSKTERRAEKAERELIKLKILTYMSTRVGLEMDAVITGVADYGFFAQAVHMPVEGLVHISTLEDDYYQFDEAGISLRGRRGKTSYRLGDRIHVRVVRVDLQRRQMDFRVLPKKETRKGSG